MKLKLFSNIFPCQVCSCSFNRLVLGFDDVLILEDVYALCLNSLIVKAPY